MFVITEGSRDLERALKQKKATPRLCPICSRSHPGGRLHLPPPAWGQLPLFDADDDEWARLAALPLPPRGAGGVSPRRAHTYTDSGVLGGEWPPSTPSAGRGLSQIARPRDQA